MITKPEHGQFLRVEDVDLIIEAVEERKRLWPNEPLDVCMKVVLFNIGRKFDEENSVRLMLGWFDREATG